MSNAHSAWHMLSEDEQDAVERMVTSQIQQLAKIVVLDRSDRVESFNLSHMSRLLPIAKRLVDALEAVVGDPGDIPF